MLYKLCPSLRYILSLDRLWFSTTQPRLINQVHLVCWFLWFKFWNLSREFWHPRQVMSITHPTWIICLSSKLEEVLLLLSVVKIWWSTLSPTYKSSSLEDLVEYFISYLTFSQNIYFDAPPWSMVKLLYFGLKLLWIILPSWQIKVDLKKLPVKSLSSWFSWLPKPLQQLPLKVYCFDWIWYYYDQHWLSLFDLFH